MKKLLGIVVLGLLWCNVGFANPQHTQAQLDAYESEMNQIYKEFVNENPGMFCVLVRSSNKYSAAWGATCKENQRKAIKLAKKECKRNTKTKCVVTRHGNNIVYNIAQKVSTDNKDKGTTTAESSGGSFTTSIKLHSETCEEIGFKRGTEKFGDCVLKLVELDVKRQSQDTGNVQIVQQFETQKRDNTPELLLGLGLGLLSQSTTQQPYQLPQQTRCYFRTYGLECN